MHGIMHGSMDGIMHGVCVHDMHGAHDMHGSMVCMHGLMHGMHSVFGRTCSLAARKLAFWRVRGWARLKSFES